MNQSFECPACKGVLQFDGGDSIFQICRHCKGKIIIPSSAVHQAQESAETGVSAMIIGGIPSPPSSVTVKSSAASSDARP